ncbi:MAG: hypothetical protein WC539_04035 [Nitrospirota bacterium]
MILTLIIILFILMFLIPFIPGAYEIRKKKDAKPLFIDMEYRKDPRYFSLSFRKLLMDSLGEIASDEIHEVTLSKLEHAEILDHGRPVTGTELDMILYIRHDLISESDVTFHKEVYVREQTTIGKNNQLQALACDGDVHIQAGTTFFRWLDAQGSIRAERACSLGVDATCGKMFSLAKTCSFTRLYGFPVQTDSDEAPFQRTGIALEENLNVFEGDLIERISSDIPPFTIKNCSLIAAKSLTIGDHVVICGHVKTHGDLIIGNEAIIAGNVFAEGSITIGPRATIRGTVFSQQHTHIGVDVLIGAAQGIKSVISKKGVTLESGVTIYGYTMTEGKGLVL